MRKKQPSLTADETEKGAKRYEKVIPGFRASFEGERVAVTPPIHLVPTAMLERRMFEVWEGWCYCLEFRKPKSEVSL